MKRQETSTLIRQLLVNMGAVLFALLVNEVFYDKVWAMNICVIGLVLLGISNIATIYRRHVLLVTPLSIFSLVWLIVVPLCSFEFPLMERMTQFQWRIVLIGIEMYFLGNYLSALYSRRYLKDKSYEVAEWKMSHLLYCVCIALLVISSALFMFNALIRGGLPAFSNDANASRNTFYLPGFALLCNLGIPAIYLIGCDMKYRKRKLFIFLAIVYVCIQFLMAVRFMLIMIIIMLLSLFSINIQRRKQLLKVVVVMVAIAIIFAGIMAFRGGAEEKEHYFIASGIYDGTVRELLFTEIARYFGMSQRTMESYMNHYDPGCSKMVLTLSPLLDLLQIPYYNPSRYGIMGYTATNIITNFYFDAGNAWWLLMLVWSFVMNQFYFSYKHYPGNILRKYLWCLACISITMSFYCYVNAYVYWCCHYIILIAMLKRVRGRIVLRR